MNEPAEEGFRLDLSISKGRQVSLLQTSHDSYDQVRYCWGRNIKDENLCRKSYILSDVRNEDENGTKMKMRNFVKNLSQVGRENTYEKIIYDKDS